MSSNELCKACTLLEGLERGMATAAIVSAPSIPNKLVVDSGIQTDRARRKMDAEGPAPDNLRTIPYFHMPVASATEANDS